MASLTPLSKGLIGLAVVGGMASAVWHLGLKDRLNGNGAQQPASASVSVRQALPTMPTTPTTVMPATTPAVVPVPTASPTLNTAQNAPPPSEMSPSEHAQTGRKLLDNGDFAQARTHLELAVQGGDAASACLLGEMTLKGQGGLPASQEQAAKLFQVAPAGNVICFTAGQ